MNKNATFSGGEPTWANACVGTNGNPQIYDYASGYASAANLLLDRIVDSRGRLTVDTLIYPICFNMRHAIELFLKAAALALEQLAKIRSSDFSAFDLASSHDLGNIWSHVKRQALQFDTRYIELVKVLDQYVADVAAVDATGQVFRYAFDLDNNKHLTSMSVINVVLLKEQWANLERLLRNLNRLNEDLLTEYGWGGFTTKLSRQQLARVATALPPRDRWSLPEFNQVKSSVCEEFNLSSNDFSKALKVIQSRRELAAICAHNIPIPNLDATVLGTFLDIWIEEHDLKRIVAPPAVFEQDFDWSGPDFAEIASSYEKSEKLSKKLVDSIEPDAFAAIRTLFYFDREENFSEIFEMLLRQYRKASKNYADTPTEYLNDARHLLEKTSALTSILNSLNFLGQTEMVEAIVDRYDLHDHIKSLLESSERARALIVQGHTYT
jgi:hypothetical protein